MNVRAHHPHAPLCACLPSCLLFSADKDTCGSASVPCLALPFIHRFVRFVPSRRRLDHIVIIAIHLLIDVPPIHRLLPQDNYVECIDVDFKSTNKEPFIDVQAGGRGFSLLPTLCCTCLHPEPETQGRHGLGGGGGGGGGARARARHCT